MIDVVGGAMRAVSVQSVCAAPLAFAAGVLSSAGPCTAPRFIAIAGLTAGKEPRQSIAALSAFVLGLIVAYSGLGSALSLLAGAGAFSSAMYELVAFGMIAWGVATLVSEPRKCEQKSHAPGGAGTGAAFLLGASFAFVVSPCCTPLVAAIAAYSASSGHALFGAGVLACFAAGHALPLVAAGSCAERFSAMLRRADLQDAARTVSSALMLAVGAYYAVLA